MNKPLRVLQVLPALNSGGVERGTVEFAQQLVQRGHESLVLSNGGRLVETLQAQGTRHITLPVHRKSPLSLRWVRPLRQLLQQLNPDIVHVRSRLPAWLVWMAWRGLPISERPALVSTFHGMYSVSPYSAIMAKPRHIIAISAAVRTYIESNYPQAQGRITLIHRGVDTASFYAGQPSAHWRDAFYRQWPQCKDRTLILMPGRLSRWKGQLTFITVMQQLLAKGAPVQGVIVGDSDDHTSPYPDELQRAVQRAGLQQRICFVGHRSDMRQLYQLSDVVCQLSTKAEPFGRTIIEALACGTPVVAYDRGGAAESLGLCLPEGLVPADDTDAVVERILRFIQQPPAPQLAPNFTLQAQADATLDVYYRALQDRYAER